MKIQMIKSSFKALVLVVVLVGSLASAGIMQSPAREGPIPLCPPGHPDCDEVTYNVAYVPISQAPPPEGPIPLCPPGHPDCDEVTYNVAYVPISQAPPPEGPIPLCPPGHPNCDEDNATYGVAYAAISLALAHTSLYGF